MMLSTPVCPMLLSAGDAPFDSDDYVFQLKWDGIRCVSHITGGKVRIFSRHGLECTHAFPDLHGLPGQLNGRSAILDGELCVLQNGKPDLEAVMERYMSTREMSIRDGVKRLPANYIVWDILELDGEDLTKRPLLQRQEILQQAVQPGGAMQVIDTIDGQGEALFEAVKLHGLEGIVAKRKDSTYRVDERSRDWIKIKNWRETICLIIGYKLNEPGVILGVEDGNSVRSVGTAEYGMTPTERQAMIRVAKDIETGRGKDVVWLKPLLKCKVKHVGTTGKGNLRDPYFLIFAV